MDGLQDIEPLATQELFRQLAANIREVFWVSKPQDGGLLYASPNFEELWGFPATQLFTDVLSYLDYVAPEDRHKMARHRDITQSFEEEFRIVRPDGTVRWAVSRGLPIRNTAGEVTLVVGITEDVTERHAHEAARRHFIEQTIAAQEDERRRVARELHDTMAQALTSLLVGLRSLTQRVQQPLALELVEQLRQTTAATLADTQRLARNLRPSVLDDLGFAPAVERLVADMSRDHGFAVDLHMTGFHAARRLPATVEITLYRAVQEALTNVARHAHASAAEVMIERSATAVRVVVEDNGVGFEVASAPGRRSAEGGLGLLGIHERVALLEGHTVIDSTRGHGTTVTVHVPITMPEGAPTVA